jgi:ABC-type uncharacterized transport system permease subunit
MIESLERRAMTLAAAAGLVVVLNSATSFAFNFGVESWKVALFVASLVAMVVCIGLAVLALAPEGSWKGAGPDRPLVLFWAIAAFALGITLIALLSAIGALQALGEDTLFG